MVTVTLLQAFCRVDSHISGFLLLQCSTIEIQLISLCCLQISKVSLYSVGRISPGFSDAFLHFLPNHLLGAADRMSFVLSGYDYPCHTNLENICVHISAYLHTHTGLSGDIVQQDEQRWAQTVRSLGICMHNTGKPADTCNMHVHIMRNYVCSSGFVMTLAD